MKEIWDQDGRRMIYNDLVLTFGPLKEWGNSRYPQGQKQEFDALLLSLAKRLSRKYGKEISSGAISQQIGWGVSRQRKINHAGYFKSYILNRAAAVETGFLTTADLPETVLLHY